MATEAMAPGVLVTRPRGPASDGLSASLRERGYRPHAQPLIELEPLAELTAAQRLLVSELDDIQHVIFISTNAVTFGLGYLADCWPQWPAGVQWYAVGDATATMLAACGITASAPESQMDSEGLLALPALRRVSNERVLIVKGEGGRGKLREVLQSRGAQVEELACYKRRCPELPPGHLAELLRERQISAVLISSGEGLAHFAKLLRPAESTNLDSLCLIVPSDRVARLAREMGFGELRVASNASDAAMIRALEECLPWPIESSGES